MSKLSLSVNFNASVKTIKSTRFAGGGFDWVGVFLAKAYLSSIFMLYYQ